MTLALTTEQIEILDGAGGRPSPFGNIAREMALGSLIAEHGTRLDTIGGGSIDASEATTGEATVTLGDNLAAAWTIQEGTTPYLVVVTTNAAERLKATKRLTTTEGITSGTERVIGGVAYSGVAASGPITGTSEAETNFDTDQYTLPANSLKVGSVVRIHFTGLHTAATGTETHTILIKVGSTTIAATGNVDPAANDIFRGWFEFVVRSIGAGGTIVGDGVFTCGPRAATPTTTHTLATGATSVTTSTFDTTVDQLIAIAIDRQAAATDGDSCRLDRMTVEIIG